MLWRVITETYEDGPVTSSTELFRSYRPAREEFEREVERTLRSARREARHTVVLEKELVDSGDRVLFEEHDRFGGL